MKYITVTSLLLTLACSSCTGKSYARRNKHKKPSVNSTICKKENLPQEIATVKPEAPKALPPATSAEPLKTVEQKQHQTSLSFGDYTLTMLDVVISDAKGNQYSLRLSDDMNGLDIKKLIRSKWGHPVESQTLEYIYLPAGQATYTMENSETVAQASQKSKRKSPIPLRLVIEKDEEITDEPLGTDK